MATATAPQQSIGATSRRPFSIKRFVILGLFWIFIGAFIGSIVAGSMDLLPFWAIPVTVIGFIAISFIWSGIFTKGVLKKARSAMGEPQPGTSAGKEVPARVEKLEEAGLVVGGFNHQFIFTLTVFPDTGSPYQTTIRQFITMGELPNFYTGRFVVFAESPTEQGYGQIVKAPAEYWTDKLVDVAEKYKTLHASTVYADKGSSLFGQQKSGSTSPVRVIIGLISTLLFLLVGFSVPFVATNNLDALYNIPYAIIGQGKTNFDSDQLKKTYHKVAEVVGDRKVESILFYDHYTILTVAHPDRKGAYDRVTIRGNSVQSEPYPGSSSIDEEDTFTMSDTSLEVLQKSLAESIAHGTKEDLVYVGFRQDTETTTTYSDEHGVETTRLARVTISTMLDDPYSSKSFTYDAKTGELIR
jgi:hypothetical protein